MPPLAHSGRRESGILAQEYADHIRAVFRLAKSRAEWAAHFSPRFGPVLRSAVQHASLWHDLGKLERPNQEVLSSESRARLPINHCDAGVTHLLRDIPGTPAKKLGAHLVYAHHIGLPSLPAERNFGERYLRDRTDGPVGKPMWEHTNATISDLSSCHCEVLRDLAAEECDAKFPKAPLLFRIALSCLVDADHADTAHNYRQAPLYYDPPLRPAERLVALNRQVAYLGKDKTDDRNRLRGAVYAACRDADTAPALIECDSPVGTGKTTAVMAHLLQAAIAKGLRRVFVVLPYTNIINQSVDVYRRCLVLPDEDPNEIVVPHHHKASFQNYQARQFTALWHAPVVVTTAVQFFETLADNRPAGLRKLHQLPGSAVFIDESHAALPARLWPRAWDWLKQLSADWGCHIVLGSGSLNRVWSLPEVDKEKPTLPPLVRADVGAATALAEKTRIRIRPHNEPMPEPLSLSTFAEWIMSFPGPRLVIVNTVQSAAALARLLANKHGRCKVEHLSTALCPDDREATLGIVKARLDPNRKDDDWTLVATSCVESGVDISFRVGFRERAGLTSLLQTAGRVNRSNEYGTADVWDFRLTAGELVASNPGVEDAATVLGKLFAEGKVSPAWCTEALRREIQEQYSAELHMGLRKAEEDFDFPAVEEHFRVIDQDTVTALVKESLIDQLKKGNQVDWQQIQQGSVNLYRKKAGKFMLPVEEFPQFPGLYRWNLGYDGFLGYMAGALRCLENADPATAGLLLV